MKKKLLILQIAALGYDFVVRSQMGKPFAGLEWHPITSVFPALTSVVQGTIRTALHPSEHGIIANGFYSRELHRTFFWEQASSMLAGERIWSNSRIKGKKVAQLFFQQSLGDETDYLLSPAPVHKHHGGMIQDCYSIPAGFYTDLKKNIKKPFDLKHYWGPLSSIKSSRWVGDAICFTMCAMQPDIVFAYIPHLDYALQKFGPHSVQAVTALHELEPVVESIFTCAHESQYDVIAFGDYSILPVKHVVYPNQILRETEFFTVRNIQGMTYPDFHVSRALALADHQIAHIYIKNQKDVDRVKDFFSSVSGIDAIIDEKGKIKHSINHLRSGELVLLAASDSWFSYQWWTKKNEMPDYAAHVDIHSKPGYDPAELFFGKTPFAVSTDSQKIRGSHGVCGSSTTAAIAYSDILGSIPSSIYELSLELRKIMNS